METKIENIKKEISKKEKELYELQKQLTRLIKKNCNHKYQDSSYVHPHNGDFCCNIFCLKCRQEISLKEAMKENVAFSNETISYLLMN